jgi:hypothetical protein
MKLVKAAAAVAFIAGCVVTGCSAETTPEDFNGTEETTAEASDAITYNAYNGSCARDLTVRTSPGGNTLCTVGWGTCMYAYWPPSGDWVNVWVPACGVRGWVLKDYLSRNCGCG